ncbi:MAG TPA: pyridoxal phosphate-dependent aminotransferase [Candidatus Acidoferrales bacterium]|nr:pyridoxal phosphate-dependent aminotransferase [Candidatus Acidoferrales bacterium]
MKRIEPSATLVVLMEKEKLTSRGIDVVDFGPGEPDFPTPQHIKNAAIKAIEDNKTKYTPSGGVMPLRQAAVDWHAKYLGSTYAPKECVINCGGKHSLFNVIHALINSGDEVLILAPYWVSYPEIVKCADGTPVILETSAESGFIPRASDIEKAITPRTKILIVNSPSNPTGAVIPEDEFAKILEVAKKHGVWVLSDECYSHFVYGNAKPFSIASLPGAKDHVIISASLSKTFAMTGWRMGYTLAPQEISDAVLKLQSQSISNPTSIAQYAALEALRGGMESVQEMVGEFAKRRRRIIDGLRQVPGVSCHEPIGSFYVFPNVAGAVEENGGAASVDTLRVAKDLLERAHVVVIPGEAFGAPGYLRISYATSMERIEEGLRRLASFFRADKPVSSAAATHG